MAVTFFHTYLLFTYQFRTCMRTPTTHTSTHLPKKNTHLSSSGTRPLLILYWLMSMDLRAIPLLNFITGSTNSRLCIRFLLRTKYYCECTLVPSKVAPTKKGLLLKLKWTLEHMQDKIPSIPRLSDLGTGSFPPSGFYWKCDHLPRIPASTVTSSEPSFLGPGTSDSRILIPGSLFSQGGVTWVLAPSGFFAARVAVPPTIASELRLPCDAMPCCLTSQL